MIICFEDCASVPCLGHNHVTNEEFSRPNTKNPKSSAKKGARKREEVVACFPLPCLPLFTHCLNNVTSSVLKGPGRRLRGIGRASDFRAASAARATYIGWFDGTGDCDKLSS